MVQGGSNPCPVCNPAAAVDVSLEPVRFGAELQPTSDLNRMFGYRPVLLEQGKADPNAREKAPYQMLDAPRVVAPDADEHRKIAEILRNACRERRQPVWELEGHWSEFLLFPARAWPILFGLAFGYSLIVPLGLGIFFSSARPDPAGMVWFASVWGTLAAILLGYTAGFWLCVLMSAYHGEAGVIRWPGGEVVLVARSLLLFLGCFLAGPALLLGVAVWYWMNAGELTTIDNLILMELAMAAACWWFFTFLAVVRGNRLRGAAPANVLQLMRRLGKPTIVAVIILLGLVLLQLPWFLGAVGLLHTNGFVGWFSLLSCSFCTLFVLTFLMRWLGVHYYRSGLKGFPSRTVGIAH
jgi:hypothetical protein